MGLKKDLIKLLQKSAACSGYQLVRTRARPKIKPPPRTSHSEWPGFLSREFDKEGYRVLELGSRVVTGANFRKNFTKAEYVGFDFYPGENVDVVGDAHKLSSYFPNQSFDLIFSSAVFEHLCMPWVAAQEIQKLLKVGGHVFIETHFSFAAHERPWNFFQFSDVGLRALFCEAMGFELVEAGMSNPMLGFFSAEADKYLQFQNVSELYCHSEILCRKVRDVSALDWNVVDIDQVVDHTRYPAPKADAAP